MKSKLSLKLTLLAAIIALGVFISSPGVSPPPAEADVTDMDPQILVVPDGTTIEIIVDAEDDDGANDVVITATDGSSNDDDLTLDDSPDEACEEDGDVDCEDADTTVDNEVDVDSQSDAAPWDGTDDTEPLTIDLDLEANCVGGPEVITVTAVQDADTSNSVEILCLDEPNITINKDTNGAAGNVEFTFVGPDCWASTPADPGPFIIEIFDTFLLADTESAEFWCAVDETYFITENTAGWDLTIPPCTETEDAAGDVTTTEDEANGDVEIDFSADITTSVECTFENALVAQGTITIRKDAPGGTASGDFDFTWSNAASCDDATSPFVLSEGEFDTRSCAATNVTYVIVETGVETGWEFISITCTPGSTATIVENEGARTVSITLDADGETADCTFLNGGAGTITIDKETVGGDGTEDFEFSLTGDASCTDASFLLQDGDSQPFTGCLAGGAVYTVTETDIPTGWSVVVSCVDSAGANSVEDADGATITLTNDGATVVCTFTNTLDEGRIRIIKDADGGTSSDDFDFEISGDDSCDATFTLSDGEEEELFCDLNDTYVVEETDLPAGWTLTDITCSADGDAEYTIDEEDGSVEIVLTDDASDSVTCTFYNREDVAALPASTKPALIDVVSSASAVGCSGTSLITAIVRDAAGNLVANSTIVVFSATRGSFSATSMGTLDGQATVLYTAPSATGGATTITASTGGFSDAVGIQVGCLPPPPAAPALLPPAPIVVQPPRTGDAGLAQPGNGSLAPFLALAVLTTLVAGGLAVVRLRA